MRVLSISPAARGGICQYTHGLCSSLATHDLDLILLTAADNTEIDYFHPRYRVVKELSPRAHSTWWRNITAFGHDFKTLKHWVAAYHPDIVHFQAFSHPRRDSHIISWLAGQGIRVCHTAHHLLPYRSSRRQHELYARLYRQCQGLFAHTEESAHELVSRFGINPRRLTLIPHGNFFHLTGVNPAMTTSEARGLLGLDPEDFCVLFFGALVPYRGIDTILRAMSHLKVYPRVKLLLAGRPGWDQLENAIDMLKIRDSVILYPDYIPIRYVGQYFNAANLVALPYRDAYSGSSIILSYSFGRPVISTRAGGVPEILSNRSDGFLVKPNDTEDLARALREAYLLPAHELSAMGQHALSLAQTRHAWPSIASATLTAYRRWLAAGL